MAAAVWCRNNAEARTGWLSGATAAASRPRPLCCFRTSNNGEREGLVEAEEGTKTYEWGRWEEEEEGSSSFRVANADLLSLPPR